MNDGAERCCGLILFQELSRGFLVNFWWGRVDQLAEATRGIEMKELAALVGGFRRNAKKHAAPFNSGTLSGKSQICFCSCQWDSVDLSRRDQNVKHAMFPPPKKWRGSPCSIRQHCWPPFCQKDQKLYHNTNWRVWSRRYFKSIAVMFQFNWCSNTNNWWGRVFLELHFVSSLDETTWRVLLSEFISKAVVYQRFSHLKLVEW